MSKRNEEIFGRLKAGFQRRGIPNKNINDRRGYRRACGEPRVENVPFLLSSGRKPRCFYPWSPGDRLASESKRFL